MTLREFLGGDVERVHDGVDALLNRDDGLLVPFDGRRAPAFPTRTPAAESTPEKQIS